MKKIIGGKIYDTDKATRVGDWDNGEYGSLNYCEETLYRKKTGEYFLLGSGGAASKYSVALGNNSWGAGETIIPLTYIGAKAWAEEKMSSEQYESIFGAIDEDTTRTMVTMTLSCSAVKRGKRAAANKGVSFSRLVDTLLTSLDEHL